MSSELDRRFTEHHFMWASYLHGEFGGAVDPARRAVPVRPHQALSPVRPARRSGARPASCAASTRTGTPRACALSMIASIGGSQPVMFDASVRARSPRSRFGVEHLAQRSSLEGPIGAALDEPARREAPPRQKVRVVLDHRRHDDVGGLEAQAVGEVVDRLGGVAADDRHVVAARVPGERQDRLAGVLVGGSRHCDL